LIVIFLQQVHALAEVWRSLSSQVKCMDH